VRLRYVWIITTVAMVVFITYFHRLVARHSRLKIVKGNISPKPSVNLD
jgi:hypothetical protein